MKNNIERIALECRHCGHEQKVRKKVRKEKRKEWKCVVCLKVNKK